MSSFVVFLLFPTYSKGNGGLGFLPKSTSWNVNGSLTDLKVIVLNTYIVPLLPSNPETYTRKCFFSWFLPWCYAFVSLSTVK